MIIHTHYC